MAEDLLSFENSVKRLDTSLSTDTKIERTDETQAELLSATLDIIYCASGGTLWENGGIVSSSQIASKDFPNGTLVSFIPVPLLSADDEQQDSHKIGVFTFTDNSSGGPTVATIGIECELTDTGHQELYGQCRFPGIGPDRIGKIGPNSLITRIAGMAQGIVKDLRVPLKK
jgi:hypothetical protein